MYIKFHYLPEEIISSKYHNVTREEDVNPAETVVEKVNPLL